MYKTNVELIILTKTNVYEENFYPNFYGSPRCGGVSAQTITFTEEIAAGSVKDVTLGDDNFKAQFVGGEKAKVSAKSLSFKVSADATAENFTHQWCPGGGVKKLSGERSVTITVAKAGTLYVYARTASNDDRDFKVVQNGSELLTATAYNAKKVEDKYYQAYKVDVAKGTVNITSEEAVNISALKFEASDDQGGSQGGGTQGGGSQGSSNTVWDFNDLTTGTTYSATQNLNNLYLQVKSGHSMTVEDVASTQKTFTLSNGTNLTMTHKITLEGAANESSDPIASAMNSRREAATGMNLDYMALDVTGAGTLYVVARANDNNSARETRLGFQKGGDKSYSVLSKSEAKKDLVELKGEVTEAGTFFIYGSIKMSVQTVVWVPSTTSAFQQ